MSHKKLLVNTKGAKVFIAPFVLTSNFLGRGFRKSVQKFKCRRF